jgi:hypothetical protein
MKFGRIPLKLMMLVVKKIFTGFSGYIVRWTRIKGSFWAANCKGGRLWQIKFIAENAGEKRAV